MSNRRELTPDQRARKIENDRRRRREQKVEVQRLRASEAELKDLFAAQKEENRRLTEEIERLNRFSSDLMSKMGQLRQQMREHQQNMKEVVSVTALEFCQSANQEVANNQGSQGGVMYADELVEDFIQKLDAKEKSDVNYSDFDGLMEELRTNGTDKLPPSLAPFDTRIKEMFGDIAANSRQSSCTAMPCHILFCAAVREMDELQLGQIDERKILLWRDAINSALNIDFKVDFAIIHLKRIARAFFGLKAWNELSHDPELMSIVAGIANLKIQEQNLQAMHAQKVEERSSTSEVRKQCMLEAEYFYHKFLSTGLLREHPSCWMH